MIAGVGDDKVNVGVTAPDFGDDVVIGDNGHVDFDTTTGVPLASSWLETIAPEHGGDDLIFVGEGDDVVLGGSGMPTRLMLALVQLRATWCWVTTAMADFDAFDCLLVRPARSRCCQS